MKRVVAIFLFVVMLFAVQVSIVQAGVGRFKMYPIRSFCYLLLDTQNGRTWCEPGYGKGWKEMNRVVAANPEGDSFDTIERFVITIFDDSTFFLTDTVTGYVWKTDRDGLVNKIGWGNKIEFEGNK